MQKKRVPSGSPITAEPRKKLGCGKTPETALAGKREKWEKATQGVTAGPAPKMTVKTKDFKKITKKKNRGARPGAGGNQAGSRSIGEAPTHGTLRGRKRELAKRPKYLEA